MLPLLSELLLYVSARGRVACGTSRGGLAKLGTTGLVALHVTSFIPSSCQNDLDTKPHACSMGGAMWCHDSGKFQRPHV